MAVTILARPEATTSFRGYDGRRPTRHTGLVSAAAEEPAQEGAPAPAYFIRTEAGFRATGHTAGAWSTSEQHISPMTGLVAHEIERVFGDDGLVLGRLSLDILGTIEVDDFSVEVEEVRPGRTISLVEARVERRGRTVALARAWRLVAGDTTEVRGGEHGHLPAPHDLPTWEMGGVWPGGYIASLDVRRAAEARPGRTTAWVRSTVDLLAGEPTSELARWLALVDTANGICVRQDPDEWLFPNVDLTIHLHRVPSGPWVGFDTRVVFGPGGLGLTETVLHDLQGAVGRASQVLTVRPR